ncbi:MAG: argininosuccinate lyase [Coriobacteriia bacterium]|nr:argininosuccinate lyase [Coriobacteriia bacterium]
MAKTAWSGRFSDVPAASFQEFGASLPVDKRLWSDDIAGSIAHAEMLASCGIIGADDGAAIVEGLKQIAADIEADAFTWNIADEDVHMAIEAELTRRIGDAGKKLHTARSRNDQVATDTRLWARRHADVLIRAARALIEAFEAQTQAHGSATLPGYTHLQKAQPVLLATHLGAYVEMLTRDITRFEHARAAADINVLGSAALAGTPHPIDRAATTAALDFAHTSHNTMDGVSDRDFVLDLIYACAVCQMHLSRLCEELILWSTEEFGFVTFADIHATGSSIMPQKKNPDFAELIRGKTGRVYGDLMALLTTMKGLPLAYNKDMQEDKEPLFDAVDTTLASLSVLTEISGALTFNVETMRVAAEGGFMGATAVADYLVAKGMPFRDAHEIVGRLVRTCEEQGRTLQELSAAEYQAICDLFDADIVEIVAIENIVAKHA